MARISQQTIDFIRKAIVSDHDALMLAGLHTLEGVTRDPKLMMQILRLPTLRVFMTEKLMNLFWVH